MGPAPRETKDWKVADLICSSLGKWDVAKVEKRMPSAVSSLRNIRPSKTGKPDSLTWLPTKDGEYSTKTGYYTGITVRDSQLSQSRTPQPCEWNSDIWRDLFSPKLRVFLWKIVMGALPIGENLEKRSLVSNTTCVHCGNRETTTHLFIHCQFAKRVWDLSPLLHTDLITEATYFGKAMKATKMTINLPPSGLSCDPLFPWICWTIWTI